MLSVYVSEIGLPLGFLSGGTEMSLWQSVVIFGMLLTGSVMPAQGFQSSELGFRDSLVLHSVRQTRVCATCPKMSVPATADGSPYQGHYVYSLDTRRWPIVEVIDHSFGKYSSAAFTARQINCDERLYRVLGSSESPESLQRGRISPWMSIPMETALSHIVDFACKT